MRYRIYIIFTFLMISFQTFTQNTLPKVVSGTIERLQNFQSEYITSRNIDIWLPEGYSDTIKYSVLYMHDGQMLFDSDITWNKQAWDIDDVSTNLFKNKNIKNFIVVGIWNDRETRHTDYFPQKPYEILNQAEKDSIDFQLLKAGRIKRNFYPQSDNYLKFMVNELKPYIDKNYSVHKDRMNTAVMGSSMGGLISMYAICEYPEIFGSAACLSTHWIGTFSLENNPIPQSILNYLMNNLPDPTTHRIYFDCGDQTLDSLYPKIQEQVDEVMLLKGYDQSSWLTQYFPGENHSEYAWNKRLHIPLQFIFMR